MMGRKEKEGRKKAETRRRITTLPEWDPLRLITEAGVVFPFHRWKN